MGKIRKIIALVVCLVLSAGIAKEADATVNSNIIVYEYGDEDFKVNIDMQSLQRGNELTCTMTIYKTQDGEVAVHMSTITGPDASEIGIRDFVFQEKGWIFWSNLYTNSFVQYNTGYCPATVVYVEPEEGKTYRGIGTHYAILDGEEYTYIMVSSELDYP